MQKNKELGNGLDELLAFIKGNHQFSHWHSGGIWVYPDSKNLRHIRLYEGCETLRKMGLIYISKDEMNNFTRSLLYEAVENPVEII